MIAELKDRLSLLPEVYTEMSQLGPVQPNRYAIGQSIKGVLLLFPR